MSAHGNASRAFFPPDKSVERVGDDVFRVGSADYWLLLPATTTNLRAALTLFYTHVPNDATRVGVALPWSAVSAMREMLRRNGRAVLDPCWPAHVTTSLVGPAAVPPTFGSPHDKHALVLLRQQPRTPGSAAEKTTQQFLRALVNRTPLPKAANESDARLEVVAPPPIVPLPPWVAQVGLTIFPRQDTTTTTILDAGVVAPPPPPLSPILRPIDTMIQVPPPPAAAGACSLATIVAAQHAMAATTPPAWVVQHAQSLQVYGVAENSVTWLPYPPLHLTSARHGRERRNKNGKGTILWHGQNAAWRHGTEYLWLIFVMDDALLADAPQAVVALRGNFGDGYSGITVFFANLTTNMITSVPFQNKENVGAVVRNTEFSRMWKKAWADIADSDKKITTLDPLYARAAYNVE